MRKPRVHRIRGVRCPVTYNPSPVTDGFVLFDGRKVRRLNIDPRLAGIRLLDIVIHEVLHAALPDLDEDAVNETAWAAARLAWKFRHLIFEDDE